MADIYTLLSQSQAIANAVLAKVKAKGYAVAEDLGSLASKNEVAKSDLASALSAEITGKANAATTLAGYGITDSYTKAETDNAIAESIGAVNKPGGSLTAAQVVSALLVSGNLGKVYDLTEDFVTTADFVEGAGKSLPAGTNIQIIDADTTGSSPSYKFDVFAGAYGVATQSGNGLMSATDKAKLDNADVTAYTGTGAVSVSDHEISVGAAAPSTSGVGGAAGTMSATDKEKLDNADVTAYTGSGAVSITNHVVSVAAAVASSSGVGGNAGTISAESQEKLDNIRSATAAEVDAVIAALDSLD